MLRFLKICLKVIITVCLIVSPALSENHTDSRRISISRGTYAAVKTERQNGLQHANRNLPRYVEDEVLVSIKGSSAKVGALDKLAKKYSISVPSPVAQGKKHRNSSKLLYKAHLKPGVSPVEASRKLKEDPDVEWAEPNYYRYIQITYPNDPSRNMQSYLWTSRAYYGWDTVTGSKNVVVAVIDTGVQWDHPDLASNIWTNTDEIPNDGLDNDNNGFIDDVRGWDFVDVPASSVAEGEDPGPRDNDPMDFYGHGTHVSGIVGAAGNNGIGVAGICWQVSIIPVRAGYMNAGGVGVLETADIADALVYAADNGADIVNMSFGGPEYSLTERAAIDYCAAAGCLLVAAAGNESTDAPSYPAAFDNVVAAASMNTSRYRSFFSNYGLWVDITAPGESCYNTVPSGTYGYKSGTSMASPVVAGTAALIKAAHPSWSANDLKLKLLSEASTDLYSNNQLFVGSLGAGCVKIDSAISSPYAPVRMEPVSMWVEELNGYDDGSIDPGETLRVKISVRNFSIAQQNVSLRISSSDPYLTITDDISVIGDIGESRTKTNLDDPVVLNVSPNTPKDHHAVVNVQMYVGGVALGTPDAMSLHLNPLLRDRMETAVHTSEYIFSNPGVVARTGGGAVVLYHSQEGESHVYTRSVNAAGTWTPAVRLSSSLSMSSARMECGVPAPDGSVHVSFTAYLGAWEDEIFYTRMNPVSGAWSSPVQVSSSAVLHNSSYIESPNAIAVDPGGNPHIVWVDYRSGGPEIYYSYHNGMAWSGNVKIATPTSGPKNLFLGITSTGTAYVVWNQQDGTSASVKMIRLTGGTWGPIEQVSANADSNQLSCALDSQDNIHLVFTGPTGEDASYMKFDGTVWSGPESVFTDTNAIGYDPEVTVGPEDDIHVVRISAPNWNYGDNTMHLYERVYRDEAWLEPAEVIYERPECKLSDPDIAVDSAGTRFVVGITSDYPHDVVLWSSDVVPSRLPSRPAVSDGGANTGNPYGLTASWSSSHLSGITEYQCAVGTAPGEADLMYWTSTGTATSANIDLNGIPLQDGQNYYVSVRSRNSLGFRSPIGTSDGIVYHYIPSITSIDRVKTVSNGIIAEITGAVVTAAFPDFFYIETDDRSCGLRINKNGHTLSEGMRADVTGVTATTASGERCLDATTAVPNGSGSVQPIGIPNRQMGGGPLVFDSGSGKGQEGVEGASGPNNIGLLVKTWGKITSSTLAAWNLDTNPGWSMGGQWAFGVPTGQGGKYGLKDPTSGYTGSNVYGVNLDGDYSTTAGGPYYLATGPVNCSGQANVMLKFRRWLNTDYQPYVEAKVQVSSDGVNWNTIWDNGSTSDIKDSTWTPCSYDISAYAANQPVVYVRWEYKIANGAMAYSGWNIDDIEISSQTNSCWIDDGSGLPVKLVLPDGVMAPPSNNWASVTAISSCERREDGKLISVLRVRKAEDIRTY